jgi:hypothetical protein
MRSMLLWPLCAAGLCVLSVAGCGSSEPKKHAVSGTVTFKGVPLKVGSIEFRPEDKSSNTFAGTGIEDGNFQIPPSNGLLPGWYKVSISSLGGPAPPPDAGPSAGQKEVVPAIYNSKTQLREEVKSGGPNVFRFDLK